MNTQSSQKPRSEFFGTGLFRTYPVERGRQLFSALLVVGIAFWTGCGPSSPRFGNGQRKESEAKERTSAVRFSSKEVEEEVRENDKKPEEKEIESVIEGKRDFKKEKNKAIAPLDQAKIMRCISKYMGAPYVHGGSSMAGMDCSGYTMMVYKESVGRALPRSAHGQFDVGTGVRFEDLKFGDLIFFNTTGASASHVGIYLGDDLFAHASVSLGVTISSLESSYYKKRYEGARRVVTGLE